MKNAILRFIAIFTALAAVLCFTACTPSDVSSASSTAFQPPSIKIPVVSTTKEPYRSPIDFPDLTQKNADICAWIKIDGTNIDYPVTTTTDNAFYLTHDAYRNRYAGGGLFIDMSNAPDFSSPVTVMYGHVMPDDTIFSQLHLYKDFDFFSANKTITLYLPEDCYTYEIFAAFPHDISNLLYEKDYTDPQQLQDLLDYIASKEAKSPNQTNLAMESVSVEDRILLLSTCDNDGASRYLVAARLAEKAAEK